MIAAIYVNVYRWQEWYQVVCWHSPNDEQFSILRWIGFSGQKKSEHESSHSITSARVKPCQQKRLISRSCIYSACITAQGSAADVHHFLSGRRWETVLFFVLLISKRTRPVTCKYCIHALHHDVHLLCSRTYHRSTSWQIFSQSTELDSDHYSTSPASDQQSAVPNSMSVRFRSHPSEILQLHDRTLFQFIFCIQSKCMQRVSLVLSLPCKADSIVLWPICLLRARRDYLSMFIDRVGDLFTLETSILCSLFLVLGKQHRLQRCPMQCRCIPLRSQSIRKRWSRFFSFVWQSLFFSVYWSATFGSFTMNRSKSNISFDRIKDWN